MEQEQNIDISGMDLFLRVKGEDAKIILTALGELPAKYSRGLLSSLENQIVSQARENKESAKKPATKKVVKAKKKVIKKIAKKSKKKNK